jgi:hypothetical protein
MERLTIVRSEQADNNPGNPNYLRFDLESKR